MFGRKAKFLKQVIADIAGRYEYVIEAVGVDENHVHIFAGAHPAIAPAKLIQVLKSITARELFKDINLGLSELVPKVTTTQLAA